MENLIHPFLFFYDLDIEDSFLTRRTTDKELIYTIRILIIIPAIYSSAGFSFLTVVAFTGQIKAVFIVIALIKAC